MKTRMRFMVSIFMVLCIAFASCTKEESVGPAGPVGPEGPVGATGVAGTNGTDGADGNVNVISSGWVEMDFGTEWIVGTFFNTYASDEITDSRITEEVHASYVMLSYIKNTNGNIASSLPIDYTILNDVTVESFFKIGSITVQASKNSDGGSDVPPTNKSVRYVLIAPSDVAGKSTEIDYSNMTYEEVMDYHGLAY